jgi:DNA transposition AAA+ family ATPase
METIEEANRMNGEVKGVAANNTRLDISSLEQLVDLYDEDLREPVMWLGCYLRDQCGRSLDVLSGRAQKLGIEMDKTNWSKILRGRWNRDAENNLLPTPIVSKTRLQRAIGALKQDARLRAQMGKAPFVETSIVRTIWDYAETKWTPERVNKFGVIVGETGTGKSAAFRELEARHLVGLVAHVESPENAAVSELIAHLAYHYGTALTYSNKAKRDKVFNTVNDRRLIIVDNAQDLYNEKRGHNQPCFAFLRRLQDQTQCTILLSMTPTGERLLFEQFLKGYFEQFEGRAGGRRNFLRLPEYPPEEDVLLIAQAFGLRDADRHLEFLVKVSRERGRIRALFEALQSAKVMAERKKTTLSIGLVKECVEED